MVDVVVPDLGESIADASVAKILKKVGDYIKVDEVLFELETDKATMEVNSPCSGIVKTIKAAEGDEVQIGSVIAIVEESHDNKPVEVNKPKQEPVEQKDLQKKALTITEDQNSENRPEVVHGKQHSPAANVLMEEKNINSSAIYGTGKDGRITKADVLQYKPAEKTEVVAPSAFAKAKEKVVPMTKLRQKIAQRLKESQNTAAILTTFNEVDMQNVINIRAKYKDAFAKRHEVKLGFMSFFIKATIAALQEFPQINAQIKGSDIVYKDFYNIGVAVGTPSGLVVPVIKNAQDLSMAQTEKEIAGFGKKAKESKLTPQDMQGGTFTISNGGIYGSLMSTPIINPPQSGILGMHSIQERPVVINKEIKIRPMMYLALSYDHRIVDGKEAVTFLVRIKGYIENPERLVLDV